MHLDAFGGDLEARLVDLLRERGKAITSLVREGLRHCARGGYDLVVLVGAPAYYARFGFYAAKPHGLDNEYGANEEFMVLELRSGSLNRAKGLVRYAPEFGEVS